MDTDLTFLPIKPEDRDDFYEMALLHFRTINPNFVPRLEWEEHYFNSILNDRHIYARWIMFDGKRVGFLIYLIEKHRFVPRLQGVIQEVFVLSEYRRKKIGTKSCHYMIEDMKKLGVEKIYVNIVAGDLRAAGLWLKNGFQKFTERYILSESASAE